MSAALIRKELLDHRWVLCAAALLSGVALQNLLISADRAGGRFTASVRFVEVVAPLCALLLANRLFVREYAGRTQLFLETLPLGRGRVFATKWLLGCGALLLLIVAAFLANLRWIHRTEALGLREAGPTIGCLLVYAVALWSVCAMVAMLGRYRYAAWLGLAMLLGATTSMTGIPLNSLGPFSLLGEDVAMARVDNCTTAAIAAATIVALASVAAAALATLGSGAMATQLAQRMTTRERVFVLVSLLAAAFVLSTLEEKAKKPAFMLGDAELVRGARATVGVMRTHDLEPPAAQALAAVISNDVERLIAALSLDVRPSIFILPQQGIDRHIVQRAHLTKQDGIVLRCAADVSRVQLRSTVIHSLLDDATSGRALKEDRHVLLDGFSALWAMRDDAAARSQGWLRAASAEVALDPGALTAWDRTSEQLGTCVADAVAFASADTLQRRLGHERMLELARALFARPHDDVRVVFEHKPAALLAEAGVPWASLATATEQTRQDVRRQRAAELAARPTLIADVVARDDALRGPTLEAELNQTAQFWVLYALLAPWSQAPGTTSRLDVRGRHAVVPLSHPRASRAFVAIERDDDVLACPVRVLARRIELP